MEGVYILSTKEVVAEYAFNWTWFWVVAVVVGVFMLVYSIIKVVGDDCKWWLIPILTVVGVMFGAVFGVMAGELTQEPIAYETEYKVIVTDEVKMGEFLEKYEIVDSEGQIYTVKEKGADKN